MKAGLAAAALAAALAALCAAGLAWVLRQPYAAFAAPVRVDIPRGSTSRVMAALLAEEGVVRHPWVFLAARAVRRGRVLQAGEYRFARPASPLDVVDRLIRGDVIAYEISIPEGYNLFEAARAVEQVGFLRGATFLEKARDPGLIRDLAPQAQTLEGYLFPDTYRITRDTTEEDLCRLMVRRFRQAWSELGSPAGAHRAVTLASLVEKETAVADERPLVASVYSNRLAQGMKLDCDPTTIYAALLEGRWRGAIYRSDLDNPHPYNTYRNPGLPPGPIANPGMASLRAALAPAETDYLFFVALPDGSGRHQFSRDLASHAAAARRYRDAQALSQGLDPAVARGTRHR